MRFIKKNHRLFFFLSWLIINLIQAGTTELFDDEAYYWIYSQYPDWGYFDHPPMIAWLIKAGYTLFPNELGVRVFTVLMNMATLYIILQLTEKKNDFLFYAIAASIAVAQIGGVIAVPDIPLLFFVSLFFYLYRRFIGDFSFINSLLLGMCTALMLYSKYHGILLVFFTLLSNPALFKKYQTYIVAVVAILLFIPHLYWQYANHFPSIQFHLFERNAARYNFSFTSEFILVQIALAGPLLGWLFLWAAFSGKPITLTERAMKFSMIGIYLVFLVSTLKGRAEANWTVPAFVSLIVLSHQFLFDKPSIRKWVFRLAPVTVLLVFITRIYMMLDIVPSTTVSKDEFHENKMAASAILQKANGLPVVFVNSYQKPSKYWFYTGKKAFALNTPGYRRNNFNYWPVEDSIIGRPVYAVGARSDLFRDSIPGNRYMENGGYRIDNYFSFSKVQITNIREELITKDLIQLTCIILAPEHYLPYFQLQPFDRAAVVMAVYDRWGDVAEYLTSSFTLKQLNEARTVTTISARHSLPAANYTIKLGIVSCIAGFPSLNSSAIKIVVK